MGRGTPWIFAEGLILSKLGPGSPEALCTLHEDVSRSVLAACGTPPSLFLDADGTAQREAKRRWRLNTILPLARLLEHELVLKLEVDVSLKFDSCPLNLAGRA